MTEQEPGMVWINSSLLLQRFKEANDLGISGVVVALLAYSKSRPFKWEPTLIAEFINEPRPVSANGRAIDLIDTEVQLEHYRSHLAPFFIEHKPGWLTPNPDLFSDTDRNLEGLRDG